MLPVELAREVASLVPNATLVEVGGAFHGSSRPEDMGRYGEAIERFILGSDRATPLGDRMLATLLFTDIVCSTDRAAAEGDTRWAELLDDHDRMCKRAVDDARGRIVKMPGDGLLAVFDGPASAITAAHKIIDQLQVIGIHVRAGVHTAEVERRGAAIVPVMSVTIDRRLRSSGRTTKQRRSHLAGVGYRDHERRVVHGEGAVTVQFDDLETGVDRLCGCEHEALPIRVTG